jgi:hypothetical protein
MAKPRSVHWLLLTAGALTLLAFSATVLAQSEGVYDLAWSAIAGGATYSSAGVYELGGAIGQPATGAMSGGPYMLIGGFWAGAPGPAIAYLPLAFKAP